MTAKKAVAELERMDAYLIGVEKRVEAAKAKASSLFATLRQQHASRQLVRYADLAAAPELQWFPLADGVRAVRIPSHTRSILFMLRFEAESVLEWHYHDCTELLTLIEGDLRNKDGHPVDRMVITEPFEMHMFISPAGCWVHLEMYR